MAKLTISLVYLVPLAMLASAWAHGRLTPALRIAALIALPVFYLVHWQFLERMSGWPTDVRIPDEFELVAASVVEPDRSQDRDGVIYLWVRNRLGEPPRSFELDYTRALHRQIVEAQRRLDQGVRQYGSASSGRESGDSGSAGSGGMKLVIRDATTRIMPAKTY